MPSLSFGNRASPGFDALTVMLGGTHRPDWVNRPDSEIQSAIRAELAQTLDISAEPVDWKIHRWPHAIPRYGVERESAVQLLEQGYCSQPGRMLFSNWSGQVSIRGMIETLSDYGIKPCSS
jgi:protoporphyrinogen oxidase